MASLIEELRHLTQGLTYPSETDAPVQVVEWRGRGAVQEILLQHDKAAQSGNPIEPVLPAVILESVLTEEEWHDEEEKARTAAWRALLQQLSEAAHSLQGFRVGRIQITLYLLAEVEPGHIVGIQTEAVET